MLYEFINMHREEIVSSARDRVRGRPWPSLSSEELEYGVPLFLTQLAETLRFEATRTPFSSDAIGSTATKHGAELSAAGFSVAQVVHDYGDICQSITEVAIEREVPITVEEFHTLNRCLDTAIAEAVTEHTRLLEQARASGEIERLGRSAHDLRDLLNGALLAFHALKRGSGSINGSTGAVLGRTLTSLQASVNRTLSEVRLESGRQRSERIHVSALVDEVSSAGMLDSEDRGIRFIVSTFDPTLTVDGDQQLLTSAVMNLLNNAFKFTPPGGTVLLTARADGDRLLLEIQDECGGIPASKGDPFQAFGERRGTDRSGLGLGLAIARQAVRAHGGDIRVHNEPGKRCTFTIDVPLAAPAEAMSAPQTA